MNKLKTRQYFCGGTSLNVSVTMQRHPGTCFIDTSDRNLTSSHDGERVFLTEGTRGAGKDRKFIYPLIRAQVPAMLERFTPAEVNIVICGLSGGSGSVIAPLIAAHLLAKGENVIVVGLGGVVDTADLDNAIDTLKTLEGIAVNTQSPVIMNYLQNAAGVPYEVVNEDARRNVEALILLCNQKHERLDTQDIQNWVRYNRKHPQLMPQLTQLHIVESRADAAAVQEPISIASLYSDPAKEASFGTQFYHTVGIADAKDPEVFAEQLHFVINSVSILETMKGITDLKSERHRQQAKFTQRAAIIDVDDNRNPDGFVL